MPFHTPVPSPATRADVWNHDNAQCHVHYQLLADVEADVLCRVLNHFALQLLVPHRVAVLQQDDTLHIEVELAGLSWHRARVIGDKLRNLISVISVELQLLEASPLQATG
ncbi:hypothetical protein DNK59_24925 [Pseudomonas sp. TKO26]|uniref:hypothetical protein n=1 Tax=unclassified Pseudomonas TaxID=196821 RepID=UPI000D90E375|nr:MULTISPECIES: hypothetical protein [unclassified Pseudomonas]PYY80136.1 hypothetical protein DNK62_24925 [Pseudomonas sp. TKO30]PYY81441.1 hypothetical protein DNK61_24300 [Pseudomonas sp. TKO29]PYY83285.1 hypothetical protein DNK59_24925 [Pseudomonas sp. TKO26]PYY97405.1 hypothetical protein DNK60_25775 [Pseudomonas sp. TKO14]